MGALPDAAPTNPIENHARSRSETRERGTGPPRTHATCHMLLGMSPGFCVGPTGALTPWPVSLHGDRRPGERFEEVRLKPSGCPAAG